MAGSVSLSTPFLAWRSGSSLKKPDSFDGMLKSLFWRGATGWKQIILRALIRGLRASSCSIDFEVLRILFTRVYDSRSVADSSQPGAFSTAFSVVSFAMIEGTCYSTYSWLWTKLEMHVCFSWRVCCFCCSRSSTILPSSLRLLVTKL